MWIMNNVLLEQDIPPYKRIMYSMQITIVQPRLDVTFKEGAVPVERSPLSPIRQHWQNFVDKLAHYHTVKGDFVRVVEMPLWQLTQDKVFKLATQANIIYIPHRQKFEHPIDNALFYMQTVFPEWFTIDNIGWGAHMSYIPIDYKRQEINHDLWDYLVNMRDKNISKFDQPLKRIEGLHLENYWLFVCQIPHDQVILQSSKISVADALRKTIALAREHGKKVLVKAHPANTHAMSELYKIAMENKDITWYHNALSIHTALEFAETVFLVNSGVGFEAMVHEKEIVTFGESEYKNVVNTFDDFKNGVRKLNVDDYKRFMNGFFQHLHYTGKDKVPYGDDPFIDWV